VPPMTTIFMVHPPLSTTGDRTQVRKISGFNARGKMEIREDASTEASLLNTPLAVHGRRRSELSSASGGLAGCAPR